MSEKKLSIELVYDQMNKASMSERIQFAKAVAAHVGATLVFPSQLIKLAQDANGAPGKSVQQIVGQKKKPKASKKPNPSKKEKASGSPKKEPKSAINCDPNVVAAQKALTEAIAKVKATKAPEDAAALDQAKARLAEARARFRSEHPQEGGSSPPSGAKLPETDKVSATSKEGGKTESVAKPGSK